MPRITRRLVLDSMKEPRMSLNAALAGKVYEETSYDVTADAIRRYAAATNEDNPDFTGADPVAPPAFPIVAGAMSIAQAMFDAELGANIMKLVHGEEDHVLHAPIKAGDTLSVVSMLESVEAKETGETFTVLTKLTDQDGVLAAELRSLMFIRGTAAKGSAPAPEPRPEKEIVFQSVHKVDEDQTYRYAEASGDHNLIHVDPDFAKNMAGLPGIILHGMCTMAFASKAVLDGPCDGDPAALKRIKVRFSKPVFPGQTLTTVGWVDADRGAATVYGFETLDPQGTPVIRNGLAEVAR